MKQQLSIGISTCPNDTFIYEALISGLKNSPFKWQVHFADVQTLNEMIRKGCLDVAKISAQVYPKIKSEYECLNCGGAIGYGCGPLLLSSISDLFKESASVTLPGADTTAALLFRFWLSQTHNKNVNIKFALFDKVYKSLVSHSIEQGVVIHEHRFTWMRDGLYLLQDLGAFWEQNTGFPIPLGIAVAKRNLGATTIKQIESEIRKSLSIARSRSNIITEFIEKKAQITDNKIIEAHIRMFVNDFSENIGVSGKAALERLWLLV